MSSSVARQPTPEGPRLGLRGAAPAGRVHRHVHQPVHRHRGPAPARGHRRRRPAAAAGARLAPDLVRLAPSDARIGPGLPGRRTRPARVRAVRQAPDGYDTATLASDLAAMMDALGHQRFAIAGHDTSMWIGYALAADHPDRVDRLAVAEAAMPGVSPSPRLFGSTQANGRLWHFAFNPARLGQRTTRHRTGRRLLRVPVRQGREETAR